MEKELKKRIKYHLKRLLEYDYEQSKFVFNNAFSRDEIEGIRKKRDFNLVVIRYYKRNNEERKEIEEIIEKI